MHLARLFPLVATFLSAPAAAAAPEPPKLEYRAFAGCPGAESFAGQVDARTPVWRASPPPFDVRLVEVEPLPDGALGRVVLSHGGRETTREIRATNCAEALEALALIVAILLDPEADTRPHVVARIERAALPPPPPPPPLAPSRPPYFVVGMEGSVVGGVGPELLLGPRVLIELGQRPPSRWFSSLRLSLLRAASPSVEQAGRGAAAFWLDTARLDGCVLRLSTDVASLEPCFGLEAGALTATSTNRDGSRSQTLGFVAADGLVRAALRYADTLLFHLELGAGLPATRYRFRFTGQAPLYTSAVVGLRAGIGVGLRFP